jgi:hypothetical protein
MLADVGEPLLDDPVRRQVEACRKRALMPLDRARDGEAGATGLIEQRRQQAKAGLGRRVLAACRVAQEPEQPAQLVQCLAARLSDRGERARGRLGVARSEALAGAGLHDHDAHAVRDHVVQLARDAIAFGGDGLAGERLLLILEDGGALREALGEVSPRPHPAPDEVGDADEDQPWHHVAPRLAPVEQQQQL